MIVCWEGLFATAIEEGDSTAPVSDKPTIRPSGCRLRTIVSEWATIRELASRTGNNWGVRGNLSGIAGSWGLQEKGNGGPIPAA